MALEPASTPKVASLDDLAECLALLGDRPLKLIAEAVQPAFHESSWNGHEWQFTREGNDVVDKKLLAFPADSFQFSVAHERSKQDRHVHHGVVEIYASAFPMELSYEDAGVERSLAVPSGVLIVTPGVVHRVKLGGFTFVFQVAIGGGQVHNDKRLAELPPRRP